MVPGFSETRSVSAPAPSSAFRGSTSSTCSTMSAARIATFFPCSFPLIVSPPRSSPCPRGGYRGARGGKRSGHARRQKRLLEPGKHADRDERAARLRRGLRAKTGLADELQE